MQERPQAQLQQADLRLHVRPAVDLHRRRHQLTKGLATKIVYCDDTFATPANPG